MGTDVLSTLRQTLFRAVLPIEGQCPGAGDNPELRLSRTNARSRTRSSVSKDRRVLPDERLDSHRRGSRQFFDQCIGTSENAILVVDRDRQKML
jgi:hypothetical protein